MCYVWDTIQHPRYPWRWPLVTQHCFLRFRSRDNISRKEWHQAARTETTIVLVMKVPEKGWGLGRGYGGCHRSVTQWHFMDVVLLGPHGMQSGWLTALFCDLRRSWGFVLTACLMCPSPGLAGCRKKSLGTPTPTLLECGLALVHLPLFPQSYFVRLRNPCSRHRLGPLRASSSFKKNRMFLLGVLFCFVLFFSQKILF